jgi:hypothetical protein
MTPKEKAKDLVDKFKKYAYYPKTDNDEIFINQLSKNAKQCALIAVEEILKVVSFYNDSQAEVIYFKEVKQEIEKL